MNTCDDCDEEKPNLEADGNPYGKNMYYCQECLERRQDADPNYDVESADTLHERAFEEHQRLHSR